MHELLARAIDAHGGLARWSQVESIEATLLVSGGLMDIKGYPGRLDTTATIRVRSPYTILAPCGDSHRGVFDQDRVWRELADGTVVDALENARASFAGHTRATPWSELQRLYFLGYALWNYLTAPFLFARQDFQVDELPPHQEDGQTWRVLNVVFPNTVPAHCREQKFYFSDDGMLKRVDYVTDVAGGVAAHYCYDPKTVDGLVFPTRRRVVQRTPDGAKVSGPTAVFLDYSAIRVING